MKEEEEEEDFNIGFFMCSFCFEQNFV